VSPVGAAAVARFHGWERVPRPTLPGRRSLFPGDLLLRIGIVHAATVRPAMLLAGLAARWLAAWWVELADGTVTVTESLVPGRRPGRVVRSVPAAEVRLGVERGRMGRLGVELRFPDGWSLRLWVPRRSAEAVRALERSLPPIRSSGPPPAPRAPRPGA
jgi:hypothetical protein